MLHNTQVPHHNHDQKNVTYASNSYNTDKKFKNLHLNHYLLWKATLYFKNLGFQIFNFGQPCGYNRINAFDDYLDDKQIDISLFKRGMGSELYTLHQGIKFYNKELLLQLINRFKQEVDHEQKLY